MNTHNVVSNIKLYGFKGAASLIPVSSTRDKANLSVSSDDSAAIPLLSMVTKYPADRIDGKAIWINDRRIYAAPDDDWDGSVTVNDKIEIEGEQYSIVSKSPLREQQTLLFVEIQVRG